MTMATAALTSITEEGGFTVATLEGEIDISNSVELETELCQAVPNDATGLVLDLAAVTFVDSSGIRTLFDLASRLAVHRQVLHLALPEDSRLRRTLLMLQIPAVMPLFPDRDSATS